MGTIKANSNLQLSLATDIDALHDEGYKSMDAASELVKKAIGLYRDAAGSFKQAQDKADQAIGMAKQLGVDTKSFDMKKANSKNAQSKADKNASISILN